eukprot:11268767-Alexandrium_andersonii.AAC.1
MTAASPGEAEKEPGPPPMPGVSGDSERIAKVVQDMPDTAENKLATSSKAKQNEHGGELNPNMMELSQVAGARGSMLDVLGSRRADSNQKIEAKCGLVTYCFTT